MSDERFVSTEPDVVYGVRLTMCKCGHKANAHYDSHLFCTWTTAEPPECECQEFEPAGPEIFVKVETP